MPKDFAIVVRGVLLLVASLVAAVVEVVDVLQLTKPTVFSVVKFDSIPADGVDTHSAERDFVISSSGCVQAAKTLVRRLSRRTSKLRRDLQRKH